MTDPGYRIFSTDPGLRAWADAARPIAEARAQEPARRARELRHGGTWLVGLDLLPNAPDGSIAGFPLVGDWRAEVPPLPLHPAQVSIIYPGYPRRDPDESLPNHRFRRDRGAAHVDGLLPQGPDKRRFAAEFHAYILMIPLNEMTRAPTVIWEGSHVIMGDALRTAIGNRDPREVDVTDAYKEARRHCFEHCRKVPLACAPGQAVLIHRHALHGTDPWGDASEPSAPEGRMIAFLRPETSAETWLSAASRWG
ncbi:MAG: hypothetical protein AAF744_15580 [Pseudomonadota bacterium]